MGEKEDKKLARSWTAKKLKKLRASLAMNQEEFGKLFGKTSRVVSRWEGGSSKPDVEALRDIDVLARDRDEQAGAGIPRLSIVEAIDLTFFLDGHYFSLRVADALGNTARTFMEEFRAGGATSDDLKRLRRIAKERSDHLVDAVVDSQVELIKEFSDGMRIALATLYQEVSRMYEVRMAGGKIPTTKKGRARAK